MLIKDWTYYWNKDNPEFDKIMEVTTKIFFENMRNRFPVSYDDVFLDYGCGPGVLLNYLKDVCKKVVGVDSSSLYVEKCNNLFKQSSNVIILKVSDFNDLERILRAEHVNNIVVHSVIQYFTSLDQLTEFLEVFRRHANVNGQKIRVLIADIIPVNHFIILDFLEILSDSLKKKYFTRYIKFIIKYTTDALINRREEKLRVDYKFFKDYAEKYNIDVSKIECLTNHKSRYSIEIIFRP